MLDGVRIIEFEALGPAPFAGMLLADLGAEVIVVHRKDGADTPAKQAVSLLDRGKKSITLDLKDAQDHAIACALVRSADGLTEGLRPGVMERLRLGPSDMHAINPRLVYGRMTGWGQTGPRASQAGHDLNYLGVAGPLFLGGLPGDVPAVPPTMLGDIGGGALYLAVGMLAGVLKARATGVGTVVDAAIVDGASHMSALLLSMGAQFSSAARGQSLLDGPHWSRCYACADNSGHIAVQCLEPKFYAQFLLLMGLDGDDRFAQQFDPALWPDQTAVLEQIFAARSRDYWADLFADSDACVAPVLSLSEAQADPHISARGIWHNNQPVAAPRFDGAPPAPPGPAPLRGQDRAVVMEDLQNKGLL